tara:strand:- start:1521 stop:3185 length:1665 start_codon:yes stop_codon:yes gene_type:complete
MDLVIIKSLECLKKYKNSFFEKKLILVFEWRAYYFLSKKKNLNILYAENFFPNSKFNNFRIKNNNKIGQIINFYNKKLFKENSFFKKKNWKFFDNFFLEIKYFVDTTHYINYILNKIFLEYKIKKIHHLYYPINYAQLFDNKFYTSVDYVLANNKKFAHIVQNIDYYKNNFKDNKTNYIFNIKNLLKMIIFLVVPVSKNKNLFVSGKNNFLKTLPNLDFANHSLLISNKNINKENFNNNSFTNNGLNLNILVKNFYNKNISKISNYRFYYYLYKYKIKKYKIIFFLYTGSFFPIFILLKQICVEFKIKNITWSHGLFGVSKIPGGWADNDFKNMKNIGCTEGFTEQKKFKFNNFYNLGFIPSNTYNSSQIKKTRKKTILLVAGHGIKDNNFYYGYDRNGSNSGLGEHTVELIKCLLKFSKNYEIIFKDYPFHSFFKPIIKDISNNKIKYISNEESLDSLLSKSDLNIFTYASNSLIQSLPYKADSFILEPKISKTFNDKEFIPFGINFFQNLTIMKSAINKKLYKNKFYYQNKKKLIDKYLSDFHKYKIFLKNF